MLSGNTYTIRPKCSDGTAYVTISFVREWLPLHDTTQRLVTYCTIAVVDDGRYRYYHGASVWNCKDRRSEDAGDFWAFKDAMRQRYSDVNVMQIKWIYFRDYYKHWANVLRALKDGKVYDPNTF